MEKRNGNKPAYTPEQLKILFDALNSAPAYLSKRFILKYLCNWSDEVIADNAKMKNEEVTSLKSGDRTWQ